MIDRSALAALAAVLHSGSFDSAAAQLRITQSAVSQRIKALEDAIGTTLIRRTRPATPTDAGRRLWAHAEAVGLLERGLARDLAGLLPTAITPLRIAVTADSLATWVLPALAKIDGVLFDLVIDDQDHSAELLRSGEVAAAITASARPVPGCDALALGALRYVGFAAPDFAARHFPQGVTAASLAMAPALTFNRKDGLQRLWAEAVTGARVQPVTHYLGSTHGITEAACAGLGWAVNPDRLIDPLIASGQLVDLAPSVRIDTPLFWQVPRQNAAVLADLTQSLRHAARVGLGGDLSAPTRAGPVTANTASG